MSGWTWLLVRIALFKAVLMAGLNLIAATAQYRYGDAVFAGFTAAYFVALYAWLALWRRPDPKEKR